VTSEGEGLVELVEGSSFTDAWLDTVVSLGRSIVDRPPSDGTLTARIEEVREHVRQRRVLADSLAVAVERCYVEQGLRLLGSVDAIAPGKELPFDAATLTRTSQNFPGQSARQVRAYVLESAPSNAADVFGRFDRLQAARLYMGMVQFGYFVSQVFRGQIHLDDEQRLTPAEAEEVQIAIQESTKHMKSEAAWAAASRRAGNLFALDRAEGDDEGVWDESRGFESLRVFSTGVQVVAASQQEEFFRPQGEERPPPPPDSTDEDPAAGRSAGGPLDGLSDAELPAAAFVRFTSAGLQAILAEGCLFGWHLWGAEAGARAQLVSVGDAAADALLLPPQHDGAGR
jgi:hypothetical protein